MKRLFFLALLPLLPSSALADPSPREIVEAVYRDAAGNLGWDELFAKAMGRKRPFSTDFNIANREADARTRKTQEPWLDFDPVSNSQDPSIHGLKIGVVTETADKATIRADFRYEADPKSKASVVFYDFVRKDGNWALNDIRDSITGEKDSGWSVLKLARMSVTPARR